MEGCTMRVEGDKLYIEVDLAHDMGKSTSGKSIGIASSHGNAKVPGRDDLRIGLNVFKPLPESEWPEEARNAKRQR